MAHNENRRRFLQTAVGSSIGAWAASSVSAGAEARKDADSSPLPDAGGVAKKFWIDPSILAWRSVPWRKVHIEYHTSRHMPKLAERFNADEFGDRLLAAHVNGATVFAKDMYGYSYFPNKHGQKHQNLSFDLLGGAGQGAEEAEHLVPRLLHADVESRTRRAASRMAGRP